MSYRQPLPTRPQALTLFLYGVAGLALAMDLVQGLNGGPHGLLWSLAGMAALLTEALRLRRRGLHDAVLRDRFRAALARHRELRRAADLAMRAADQVWWRWHLRDATMEIHGARQCILGYRALGVVQPEQAWWDRLPEAWRAPVRESLEPVRRGLTAHWQHEHQYHDQSGRAVWVSEVGEVVERDAEGRPLVMLGTTRVIEGRKRIEAELERHRRLLEQILRQVPGIIFRLERRGAQPALLTFLTGDCPYGPSLRAKLPVPAAEAFGAVALPEDRPPLLAGLAAAVAAAAPWQGEFRLAYPDGSVHCRSIRAGVDMDDGKLVWTGLMLDTTAERQAALALAQARDELTEKVLVLQSTEAELLESRERLAMATQAAGLGIFRVYPGSGALWWDEGMHALHRRPLGQRPASAEAWLAGVDLLGQDHPEVLHTDDGGTVYRRVYRLPPGPEPEREVELTYRVADKPEGEFWTGVARDVTAQRRHERELREARDVAERANRARSQFLAVVSHELRTPLNPIIGWSDMLEGEAVEEHVRTGLRAIRQSGEVLLEVINDILDFTRIESDRWPVRLHEFPLPELVREILSIVEGSARAKGLYLRPSLPPGLDATVFTDRTMVRRILLNLLNNACKFTERGGVTLGLEWQPGPPGEDGLLLCRVADTGIGIAPERQRDIFEPFTQLDAGMSRRFGGTGLGLSICRELAHRLGGALTVESAPGRGSIFTLAVPLRLPPVPLAPAAPAAGRPRRVLVVDDEPANCEIATAMLTRLGLEARTAHSGEAALATLSNGGACDVVLMDVIMPGLDGFETARRIRSAGPPLRQPRIIALTAYMDTETPRRCLEAGMDGVLPKPFSLRKLREILGLPGRDTPPPAV